MESDDIILRFNELSRNMIGWIGCALAWWFSGYGFKP